MTRWLPRTPSRARRRASWPGTGGLEQPLRIPAGLRRRQEQVLGGDVLVAEPPGLVLGPLDERTHARVEAELAALTWARRESTAPSSTARRRAGRRRAGAGS